MIDINTKYLSQDTRIKKEVLKNSLSFIQSPTGSGKTTFISTLDLQNTLYISVNRTNCIQLYISLSKIGTSVKPYISMQDKKTPMSGIAYTQEFFKKLKSGDNCIINALSLHRVKNYIWENIIIDEISSLLDSIVEPIHSINSINHIKAIESFVSLIQKAKHVICLDGYITDNTIRLYSYLSKKKGKFYRNSYKVKKKAIIVELSSTSYNNFIEPKTDTTRYFYNKFNYSCKTVSKFLVSSTTRSIVESFYQYIMDNYPDLLLEGQAISLTSETLKFYEDRGITINDLTKNPILLLYSPVVVTALDIKNYENEEIFHIIHHNHMNSTANYQMINRARDVKQVIVFLPKSSYNTKKIQDFESLFLFYFKKYRMLATDNSVRTAYNQKMVTFVVNYVRYLIYLDTKNSSNYFNKFIESYNNGKLFIPKGKQYLIKILHYYYKIIKSDFDNSTASNFIKLLQKEGYELEFRTEYVESKKSMKVYLDNMENKIKIHFKMKGITKFNSKNLSIVKLCQYLYLSNLYKKIDFINERKDEQIYNFLVNTKLPKFCHTALKTNGSFLKTSKAKSKKLKEIRNIFYENGKVNKNLEESVVVLTKYQTKLYKDIL